MKPITSLATVSAASANFPDNARSQVGHQLSEVQQGRDPDDWKPMKTIGPGVRESRVREASGAFRIIYPAALPDTVLFLHAFQKKTEATATKDIDLATTRLRAWKA